MKLSFLLFLFFINSNQGITQNDCISSLPANYETELPNYIGQPLENLLTYININDDNIDYVYSHFRPSYLAGVSIVVNDECTLRILFGKKQYTSEFRLGSNWDFELVKKEKIDCFGFYFGRERKVGFGPTYCEQLTY